MTRKKNELIGKSKDGYLDHCLELVDRVPLIFTNDMFREIAGLKRDASRNALDALVWRGDLHRVGGCERGNMRYYSRRRWSVRASSPFVMGLAVRFVARVFSYGEASAAFKRIGRKCPQLNRLARNGVLERVAFGRYQFPPEFVELARAFFDANGIRYAKGALDGK